MDNILEARPKNTDKIKALNRIKTFFDGDSRYFDKAANIVYDWVADVDIDFLKILTFSDLLDYIGNCDDDREKEIVAKAVGEAAEGIAYPHNDDFSDFDDKEDSAETENEYEGEEIFEDSGYTLTQGEPEIKGAVATYRIYDENDVVIAKWQSIEDAGDLSRIEFYSSGTYRMFIREVAKKSHNYFSSPVISNPVPTYKPATSIYNRNQAAFDTYYSYGRKGYLEMCNKSNTLVFHRADPSTTMLAPIYAGKGWDVIQDSNIDKEELHKLLESHERIVMIGHGTPSGLMGGNITPAEAPYLKDKKIFVIWCNADQYFNRYLPDKHGFFCTKNAPSDAREAAWVGYNVSEPYMNRNITDWCQYCADVVEECLEGDATKGVEYIRNKYWEKYGQGYDVTKVTGDARVDKANGIPDEVGVTKYNWDSAHVQ